jgi:tetratricopeptide (TPR) repeat protein
MKKIFMFLAAACFFANISACVQPQVAHEKPQVAPEGIDSVYYPKLPSGIETIDGAKKDLADLLKNQTIGVKYYGQQGMNDVAGQDSLKELVRGNKGSVAFWYDARNELSYMTLERIAVLDDRIEMSPRIIFYYSDLTDNDIIVKKTGGQPAVGYHIVGKNTAGLLSPYMIHFPDLVSFHFADLANAQRFADNLFFIQKAMQKNHDEQRFLVESKAAQYRALKVKPPVSEEQRRFIVQAAALSQQKEYGRAIDLYRKAIGLDPVSYPGVYFNMAMIYAQERRFKWAISCMEQYLLLEPEAKDARGAQDKIYEWEIMIKK